MCDGQCLHQVAELHGLSCPGQFQLPQDHCSLAEGHEAIQGTAGGSRVGLELAKDEKQSNFVGCACRLPRDEYGQTESCSFCGSLRTCREMPLR